MQTGVPASLPPPDRHCGELLSYAKFALPNSAMNFPSAPQHSDKMFNCPCVNLRGQAIKYSKNLGIKRRNEGGREEKTPAESKGVHTNFKTLHIRLFIVVI